MDLSITEMASTVLGDHISGIKVGHTPKQRYQKIPCLASGLAIVL